MAKREIKSLRQKHEERRKELDELSGRRFRRFRDRLVPVRTAGYYWSVLDRLGFFVCGYCGQRMSLFSTSSLINRKKSPNLYYGCIRRCVPSGIHRAAFLDNKVIEFLYNRLKEIYPKVKGSTRRISKLQKEFEALQAMEAERIKILNLLPHAGYNRDDLLTEIIEVENKIDSKRGKIAGLDDSRIERSDLLSPVFSAESPEELFDSNLLYRRELVTAMVERIRFFNETLILRVAPITDNEKYLDEEGLGKLINMHLAHSIKRFSEEDMKEPDVEETKAPSAKKVDIEFIMSEDEYSPVVYKAKKPVDLDLLRTEPGSFEEKEARKKKKD